jgi:hypothetical protein
LPFVCCLVFSHLTHRTSHRISGGIVSDCLACDDYSEAEYETQLKRFVALGEGCLCFRCGVRSVANPNQNHRYHLTNLAKTSGENPTSHREPRYAAFQARGGDPIFSSLKQQSTSIDLGPLAARYQLGPKPNQEPTRLTFKCPCYGGESATAGLCQYVRGCTNQSCLVRPLRAWKSPRQEKQTSPPEQILHGERWAILPQPVSHQ